MNKSTRRKTMFLLCMAFGVMWAAGCHANPSEEGANPAMSDKQKAIIAEHKKQGEQ